MKRGSIYIAKELSKPVIVASDLAWATICLPSATNPATTKMSFDEPFVKHAKKVEKFNESISDCRPK